MVVGSRGGGGGGGSSRSNRERGIPYGVMLLLAFGAAVLGVMVLHKLRERRIVTLLIKDKDRDLMTLHLLLQKERESSKEMKRKIEELKAKTSALRTQKLQLTNKFEEMQSMVYSLKDEHRALESTIEEKQNEIKLLQQNKEMDCSVIEKSQVTSLKEVLKQKEAEIEELKRLVENATKIWSVSTDDPSKSSAVQLIDNRDRDWGASPREEQSEKVIDGEVKVKSEEANASEGIDTELEKQQEGPSHVGEEITEESHIAEIIVDEEPGEIEKNSTHVRAADLNDKVENTDGGNTTTTAGDSDQHENELEGSQGAQDPESLGKISKHVIKSKKMGRLRRKRRVGRSFTGQRNAFGGKEHSKVSGVRNDNVFHDSKYKLNGQYQHLELNKGMLHNAVDGKQNDRGEAQSQIGTDDIDLSITERQAEKQHESETEKDSTTTKVSDTLNEPARGVVEQKLDDGNTYQSRKNMETETGTHEEPNIIRNTPSTIAEMIRRRHEQHSELEENGTENSQTLDKTEYVGTEGQEANSILRNGEEGGNT